MSEIIKLDKEGKVEALTTTIRSKLTDGAVTAHKVQFKNVHAYEQDEDGKLTGEVVADLKNRTAEINDETLAKLIEVGCTPAEISGTYKVLGKLFEVSI